MKSEFGDRIYSLTRQIPRGKVATYGQLAALGGKARAARAVGGFMRRNDNAPHTPCHRVVAWDGSLVGYSAAGGIKRKREMLLGEGVYFKGDEVDLSSSLWKAKSS